MRRTERIMYLGWCSRLARAAFALYLSLAAGFGQNAPPTLDQTSPAPANSFADLSLDQLLEVSVTSVGKKEQKIADAPAAIYVLDHEDIRRSGARNVPEALRMVPGLSVAQLRSHTWIITARGFAREFAGKLLVLIDGRSVYSPSFSGVYWDVQNLLLEDIDRIEVIRGPGATLWGANAVNGVINIITKSAQDTQGAYATGFGGNAEYGGGARYGGKLADGLYYRLYAKYNNYDRLEDFAGSDDWRLAQGGLRLDWEPNEDDHLTFQGDVYAGEARDVRGATTLVPPTNQPVAFNMPVAGGNVLGRWTHIFSADSQIQLQAYYDRTERANPFFAEFRDLFDVELQWQLALTDWNELVCGAGYRYTAFRDKHSFTLSEADASEQDGGEERHATDLYNFFLQDELRLIKDRLTLAVGSKFEKPYYGDWAIQPTARLLWRPHPRHSLWGAVSRAARTPNYMETSLRVNYAAFDPDGPGPALPTLMAVQPNPDLKNETVLAYELGYRFRPRNNLQFDLATFYNDYDHLYGQRSPAFSLETSPAPPHGLLSSLAGNVMAGETYGVELGTTWQATDFWRVSAGYTWLSMHLRPTQPGATTLAEAGNSPAHQFHARSFLDLPGHVTFDTLAYYVGRLPNQGIDSYLRLDLRLGWRPKPQWELSAGVRNLLDHQHAEFKGNLAITREVPRTVYGQVSWRF